MADPKGGIHPMMLPLLLAMTGNNTDIDKQLAELANFIQSTQAAVQSLRSGVETFHAGLNKISRPPAPSTVNPNSGHNSKGGATQDESSEKVSFTDSTDTN